MSNAETERPKANANGDEVIDETLTEGVAPEEEIDARNWTLPDTVKGPQDHIANAPFDGRDPGETTSNRAEQQHEQP